MTKRNKIIYWVSTLWLALGMTSTGIVQFIKMKEEVDLFNRLGLSYLFSNNTKYLENIGSCSCTYS